MDKIWLKSYPPGVPAEIDVGEFQSLKEIAEQSFRRFADSDAYVQMGRTMTFAELDEQSRHFAAWLQKEAALKKGRPARHHASESSPISRRDARRLARRPRRCEYQPPLYATGARASVARLGRRGDRHPREFRPCFAESHSPHQDPRRRRHRRGRYAAIPKVVDRQLRRASDS